MEDKALTVVDVFNSLNEDFLSAVVLCDGHLANIRRVIVEDLKARHSKASKALEDVELNGNIKKIFS
jgi:hypothetical protein